MLGTRDDAATMMMVVVTDARMRREQVQPFTERGNAGAYAQ